MALSREATDPSPQLIRSTIQEVHFSVYGVGLGRREYEMSTFIVKKAGERAGDSHRSKQAHKQTNQPSKVALKTNSKQTNKPASNSHSNPFRCKNRLFAASKSPTQYSPHFEAHFPSSSISSPSPPRSSPSPPPRPSRSSPHCSYKRPARCLRSASRFSSL